MLVRTVGVCLALGFLLAGAAVSARVEPKALLVSKELNATAIDRVLRRYLRAFDYCGEKRAAAGVTLAGTVTLEWTVGANGRVTEAKVAAGKSTVHDEALEACLVSRVLRLRFGETNQPGTVSWVLAFRADTDKKEGYRVDGLIGRLPGESLSVGGGGGGLLTGKGGESAGIGGLRVRGTVGGSGGGGAVHRGVGSGSASSSGHIVMRSPGPPRAAVGSSASAGAAATPAPSLKAGRHDDNKQFNRFVEFVAQHASFVPYPLEVSERLVVRTLDQARRSLHNCAVEVHGEDGARLARGITYADGSTHFFPADSAGARQRFVVDAVCGAVRKQAQLERQGPRALELLFDLDRHLPESVPLDLAIVIDTTGSMGGQIQRLKQTLEAIHLQLTELPTRPDLRFGLVAYRDRGDDYVTRVTPFTRDVEQFQRAVRALTADGGGDTPEELQPALRDALEKLDWRAGAVRLGFVIADAVPHTDYPNQGFTYRDAMRTSLERGIKWSMVGAGGLPLQGELIFRQLAQYTMGEYVFVTPHEVQRDTGGDGAEASHHVGTNYLVENLDQAIVRIVRRELSYLTDAPREVDDTIVARASAPVPRDKLLAPAVQEVLRQLTDYSAIRLREKTPVAVVPVSAPDEGQRGVAEYLGEQLVLGASRRAELKVVERDLAALAQEQRVQLSDLFDATTTVPFGKLLGAELLIVTRFAVRETGGELYARLLRVETGEILSAAKVRFEGEALRPEPPAPATALLTDTLP